MSPRACARDAGVGGGGRCWVTGLCVLLCLQCQIIEGAIVSVSDRSRARARVSTINPRGHVQSEARPLMSSQIVLQKCVCVCLCVCVSGSVGRWVGVDLNRWVGVDVDGTVGRWVWA